ncbi:hypothetical protein [Flammeovirga aprica]|uniref:Uncharacterized protein n=1 Tax=Flammeovirga aprica JL-4 TaxID=694437 RepID=A0A7X9RZ91_9BACT|nr:hypothetical protein [Flammeovirga aprica]NME71434.1 hypothetical protein [Flammeovirga aprica JL-4]
MNFKAFFNYLSYLQYPLMLIATYFAFSPYLSGWEHLKQHPEVIFESLNQVLIFMGLGTSFSSLQDTTKTQNNFSKKVWENPTKGKITLLIMCIMILTFLTTGLIGYFKAGDSVLKDLSVGIIVLSLGLLGFLKTAIEMFEYHRKDKVIIS